jgi:hypothetical protein
MLEFEPGCSPADPGVVKIFNHAEAGSTTEHMAFPQPLPIDRADSNWCVEFSAQVIGEVVIVGYYY